jgi:hypothetical protein
VDLGAAAEEARRQGVDLDRLALDKGVDGVAELDSGGGGVDADVGRAKGGPVVVAVLAELVGQLGRAAEQDQDLPPVVLASRGDRGDIAAPTASPTAGRSAGKALPARTVPVVITAGAVT